MIEGAERVFLACYAAFLGLFIAFVGMPLIGTFTNWEALPQLVWFFISAPVLAIGGFILVWRFTRP